MRVVNTTSLLYRTPSGAQSVPAPTQNIDVRSYEKVRVAAGNRCGSPGSIKVILTHGEGTESVVRLDEIVLAPCASFSKSFDVPGTGMFLMAHPVTAGRSGNFYDAVVYGHN